MIDIKLITDKQKLTIEKGLCDYKYIMNHRTKNDSDFQEIYYNFYLKARWAVMNARGNKTPYFNKLQAINPNDDLLTILDDLKNSMSEHGYEFSLGSKLLHTRNDIMPIYDRKVCNYLASEEGVDFWWHHSPVGKGASRGFTNRQKIDHDWNKLKTWYTFFIPSARGQLWIEWFNSNFPTYASISDIKKIDFIIFATR